MKYVKQGTETGDGSSFQNLKHQNRGQFICCDFETRNRPLFHPL